MGQFEGMTGPGREQVLAALDNLRLPLESLLPLREARLKGQTA